MGRITKGRWKAWDREVAIPIPSGEGQNTTHLRGKVQLRSRDRTKKSQYLYLLVKVRTGGMVVEKYSPARQNEGRNTYTFW
jgi:hypothetical protein